MTADWWLSTGVMLAGAVGALVLMIIGFIVLIRAALRFGDRLSQSAEFPLQDEVAALEGKISRLERRIDEFPTVIARAGRALDALRSSRAQAAAIGASLNVAAQFISALITGPEKRNS
jgi:hypothetical protein